MNTGFNRERKLLFVLSVLDLCPSVAWFRFGCNLYRPFASAGYEN